MIYKIYISLVFLFLSIQVLSQKDTNTRSRSYYFSLGINPHFNRFNISEVSGSVNKLNSWAQLGLNVDLAFSIYTKKMFGRLSMSHGTIREGFYLKYDFIDNQMLNLNSLEAFEKSYFPIHYSSLKMCVGNKFKFKTQTVLCYYGLDIRLNWGTAILTDGNRRDVSIASYQAIGGEYGDQGKTVFFQSNSWIERQISVNPMLGLEYGIPLKDKATINTSVFWVAPFLTIIRSEFKIYPEFEDLKSSFVNKYRGGLIGLGLTYSFKIK
jgi:hypothetical protein